MIDFTERESFITFSVRVIPRASKSGIVGEFQGALKIKIASPPVEGAANAQLIKMLSKTFRVSKHRIEISSGANSKIKQIKIFGLTPEDFLKLFDANFSGKQ